MVAQRLKQTQRPECVDIGSIFGDVERYFDVALRTQVIDLIWIDLIHDVAQRRRVREIAVMQRKIDAANMGVVVELIDPVGIEEARASDNAVHLVALSQQKPNEIGPILPRHASDQRPLGARGRCRVFAIRGHFDLLMGYALLMLSFDAVLVNLPAETQRGWSSVAMNPSRHLSK